jgi:hypothetical protein
MTADRGRAKRGSPDLALYKTKPPNKTPAFEISEPEGTILTRLEGKKTRAADEGRKRIIGVMATNTHSHAHGR